MEFHINDVIRINSITYKIESINNNVVVLNDGDDTFNAELCEYDGKECIVFRDKVYFKDDCLVGNVNKLIYVPNKKYEVKASYYYVKESDAKLLARDGVLATFSLNPPMKIDGVFINTITVPIKIENDMETIDFILGTERYIIE